MTTKPKRKNVPNRDSFDFLTAYSINQCVEQLKDAAFRTMDRQLSVRFDGWQFVVEVPGATQHDRFSHKTFYVTLTGRLIPQGSQTRVQGTVQDSLYRYGMDSISWGALLAGVVSLLMGIFVFSGNADYDFSRAYGSLLFFLGFGLLAITISLVGGFRRRRKSERQRADLIRRVRLWLET